MGRCCIRDVVDLVDTDWLCMMIMLNVAKGHSPSNENYPIKELFVDVTDVFDVVDDDNECYLGSGTR